MEKRVRGFAAMDPEKQREIARKGGKSAHAQGLAHKYTSEQAQAAGRKSWVTNPKSSEYMAKIGRKGGLARGRKV